MRGRIKRKDEMAKQMKNKQAALVSEYNESESEKRKEKIKTLVCDRKGTQKNYLLGIKWIESLSVIYCRLGSIVM